MHTLATIPLILAFGQSTYPGTYFSALEHDGKQACPKRLAVVNGEPVWQNKYIIDEDRHFSLGKQTQGS